MHRREEKFKETLRNPRDAIWLERPKPTKEQIERQKERQFEYQQFNEDVLRKVQTERKIAELDKKVDTIMVMIRKTSMDDLTVRQYREIESMLARLGGRIADVEKKIYLSTYPPETKIQVLKCPECSATMEDYRSELTCYKCRYCGAVLLITRG